MVAKRIVLGFLVFVFLLGASFLFAAQMHFPEMDADGDGLVDAEEFAAALPDLKPEVFQEAAGEDGLLSHAEWHDYKQAHDLGHGHGHGHGQGHGQGQGSKTY